MAESDTAEAFAPSIASHIRRNEQGQPYLAGTKCGNCGHTFVGAREVCAKCYARSGLNPVKLAQTGKIYTWSIIYRSFPGIDTPFIDVIVDLADGAHIKGILKGVEADPEVDYFDMLVRVDFREVVPPGADEAYLVYYFVPLEDGEQNE